MEKSYVFVQVPWVSWRSFFPASAECQTQDCAVTDYWQERLLHFGLTGARRFYYFNVFYSCLYGDRTTHEDNDIMSSALAELDAMVGCAVNER